MYERWVQKWYADRSGQKLVSFAALFSGVFQEMGILLFGRVIRVWNSQWISTEEYKWNWMLAFWCPMPLSKLHLSVKFLYWSIGLDTYFSTLVTEDERYTTHHWSRWKSSEHWVFIRCVCMKDGFFFFSKFQISHRGREFSILILPTVRANT